MESHCVVQMAANTCLHTTEKKYDRSCLYHDCRTFVYLIKSDIKYSGCFYLLYFCWSKSYSCILDSQQILLNQLRF